MSEYKPEDLEREATRRHVTTGILKFGPTTQAKLRAGAQAMRDLEAARERVNVLEQHLENMCKCADEVGVNHFDTDTIDEDVERMQTCTLAARAALQVKP